MILNKNSRFLLQCTVVLVMQEVDYKSDKRRGFVEAVLVLESTSRISVGPSAKCLMNHEFTYIWEHFAGISFEVELLLDVTDSDRVNSVRSGRSIAHSSAV